MYEINTAWAERRQRRPRRQERAATPSTPATAGNRARSYVRMSTGKQETSPQQQREGIASLVEREGFEFTGEYHDDARSGTEILKRPDFRRMLADAAKGEFDVLVVWNLERFSREDSLDAGRYVQALRKAGVRIFRCVGGEFDLSQSVNRVMYALEQEGANQYSVKLSADVTRGKSKALEAGRKQGRLNWALDKELIDERGIVMRRLLWQESFIKPRGWDYRLIPTKDKRVLAAAMWMFKQAAAGMSFVEMAKELIRRDIPTPKPGGQWHPTTIYRIVQNPVYVGDCLGGLYRHGIYNNLRAEHEAPKLVRDAHEPLVSRDLFQRVQDRIAQRYTKRAAPTSRCYILSGLLVCGHCDAPMDGHKGCPKTGLPGYKCRPDNPAMPTCKVRPRVTGAGLERFVVNKVLDHVLTPKRLNEIKAHVTAQLEAERRMSQPKQKLLAQIAKLDDDIRRGAVNLLKAKSDEAREAAEQLIAEWRAQRGKLEARLGAGHKQKPTLSAAKVVEVLKRLRDELAAADFYQLNTALRQVVQRVVMRKVKGATPRCWEGVLEFKPSLGIAPVHFTQADFAPRWMDTTLAALRRLYRDGEPVKTEALAEVINRDRRETCGILRRARRAGMVAQERYGHWKPA